MLRNLVSHRIEYDISEFGVTGKDLMLPNLV